MSKSLYLIDAFSLIFQVFHALPAMSSPKGEPTNAIFGFVRDIQAIIRSRRPTHLIVALEGDGVAQRSLILESYKANRAEMPEDLRPQIPRIIEVVDAFGIPAISHTGWEADDVIATLARQAAEDGFEVRIVTSDKDARQLIGPQVKLFNCRKNQFLDEESLFNEWGIRPDQVTDFQGLVGDSTDNIPGVPKVGPAAARALLDQFGTLANVLAGVEQIAPHRAVNKTVRANLVTFAEQARLSQRLATLQTDLPLDFDWDKARVTPPDVARLKTLYNEFGFRRLSEELNDLARQVVPATEPLEQQASPSPSLSSATSSLAGPLSPASPARPVEWRLVDTPERFTEFLIQLREQPRFCLDLETSDIDPMRAKIVGWAFAWEEQRGWYLPVDGPPGTPLLDPEQVITSLKPILEDPDVRISNQNLKYELLVLRRAGLDIAELDLDPMVGDYLLDAGARSHGLDALADRYLGHEMIPIAKLIGKGKEQKRMFEVEVEQVAEYAAEDARVAWQLSQIIEQRLRAGGLWNLYWDLERPIIRVLAEMEFNGIRIDREELAQQSRAIGERLVELTAEIHEIAGHEFNINSPKQLQTVLFDELKLPIIKRTKTGPSTDAEVLERLAPRHELPARIIEHRTLAKLQGTYLEALPRMVHPETGKIHCSFNQVVAATGRLSSSEPNLQNIPIRTEEGRAIRKAFIASEPGWRLIAADYSQVELRMLAHFSGDETLMAAFREGRDIHRAVASDIFGVPLEDVTSEMRRIAKTVNFGVIYGQSPFGLSAVLNIPQEQAAEFINQYLARYAGVAQFIQSTLADVREKGYATTILGRRRPISGIRPRPTQQMTLPERTAFNAVIQGSAADLIKRAMIRIHDRLKALDWPARLLLQIHDELVLETPAEHTDELQSLVREEMSTALTLSVPLEVDTGVGGTWFDTK